MRILRRLRFRRRVRFFFHLARILAAALCCGVEERGRGRSTFAGFQRNAGEKRNCPPHAGVFWVGRTPAGIGFDTQNRVNSGLAPLRNFHVADSARRASPSLLGGAPARLPRFRATGARRRRHSSPRFVTARFCFSRLRGGVPRGGRVCSGASSAPSRRSVSTTFRRLFSRSPASPLLAFRRPRHGFPPRRRADERRARRGVPVQDLPQPGGVRAVLAHVVRARLLRGMPERLDGAQRGP